MVDSEATATTTAMAEAEARSEATVAAVVALVAAGKKTTILLSFEIFISFINLSLF